jgi:hypothetical protein
LRCVNARSIFLAILRFGWCQFLKEQIEMQYRLALIGTVAAVALAVAPLTPASAHGFRHGGGLIGGIFALGAVAAIGAATIATAPLRALAPPAYYGPQGPRGYYAPPPQYYYPRSSGYYAPLPAYYAPPPGYYYGR